MTLPALEPLEIHSGMAIGRRRSPLPSEQRLPEHPSGVRETLERVLLDALSRPPCVIAFSGGRDSSAVLALATHVARREGLPDPVAMTHRFEEHGRTHEAEWQEPVVRHLGLADWEVVPGSRHFDVLGSNVRRTLSRHGLYWPPNFHALIPFLARARGGSVVTGSGGDEIFTPGRSPSLLRALRALPPRRAAVYLAQRALPSPWKERLAFRGVLRLPWLTPDARREVIRMFLSRYGRAADDGLHPVERMHESRYLELYRGIGDALALDEDVRLTHLFREPAFFAAWMREVPREGYPTRARALEALFGDVLPRITISRRTKATFTDAAWGPESRRFAAEWDGTGLDPAYVVPDEMRRAWARPRPEIRTATPLQAAWLASAQGGSIETPTRVESIESPTGNGV